MESPEVSIIVPVFNSSATLDRCILSIERQSFGDWELLLVDNGSTDNSFQLIRNWAHKDERILAIQELTKGVASARNTALNNARGQYVCFIDSDDEVEPDYLGELISSPDADLTLCGYFVDEESRSASHLRSTTHIPQRLFWDERSDKNILIPAFENGYFHLCCNKLFRRSIIERHEIRFEQIPVNEDFIFTLTFLQFAKSVSIIDKPLYHWIRVDGNISGVKSLPDNLLKIYNYSHEKSRFFFCENPVADRIAYFSYEMIIYKYYEAITREIISKENAFQKLRELTQNKLVKDAYKAYTPISKGEKILYTLMKHGLYKVHYFITQKILKLYS